MDATDKVIPIRSSHSRKQPKVWCIASGKGGVGKSFISSSLGITLTKMGYSVTVVDLDLSGANIHTCYGMHPSSQGLRQYLEGKTNHLQEVVTPTPIPHLSFIQGLWDSWAAMDLSIEQVEKLHADARTLNTDIVIFDVGAGATKSHLHLFKLADEKVLVTNPEPICVEKTYRFIESFLCHSLSFETNKDTFSNLITHLQRHREEKMTSPFSFRNYLKQHTVDNVDHFEKIDQSPIHIIVNSCRSHQDQNLGFSIKSVCGKYYDIKINFAGAIDFDNAVWQSVRKREHVLTSQPFTGLGGQFLSLTKHLVDSNLFQAVV